MYALQRHFSIQNRVRVVNVSARGQKLDGWTEQKTKKHHLNKCNTAGDFALHTETTLPNQKQKEVR